MSWVLTPFTGTQAQGIDFSPGRYPVFPFFGKEGTGEGSRSCAKKMSWALTHSPGIKPKEAVRGHLDFTPFPHILGEPTIRFQPITY
jgi:hypothetical protein